ncbi:MAG: hypothetical protein ACJAXX_002994, partial [Roseivirga sp.]
MYFFYSPLFELWVFFLFIENIQLIGYGNSEDDDEYCCSVG